MPPKSPTKVPFAALDAGLEQSAAPPGIDDIQLVDQARCLLGLMEFAFFKAAWRQWHGTEAEERRLERAFVAFLFRGQAPVYVRAFARRVLNDAARGTLDPVKLGGTGQPAPDRAIDLADPTLVALSGFLLAGLLLFIL